MAMIEDHVMPMLMDAMVRVAAETIEENRSSVVESIIM